MLGVASVRGGIAEIPAALSLCVTEPCFGMPRWVDGASTAELVGTNELCPGHEDHRAEWPVFICGCHRSGTTLLRLILDCHPRLACPPESKFIAGIERFLEYPQALRGLETIGINRRRALRDLGTLIRQWFDSYAHARGKARWIDKTPNYFRVLPLIDQMFESQVYYIIVQRHPLDVVESLREVRDFAEAQPEDPEIALAVRTYGRSRDGWARYWSAVNTALMIFAEAHGDRCILCRYENLATNAEYVTSQILSFIGERPVAGLTRAWPTEHHTHGYGDWKIQTATGVYRTSIGRWKTLPAATVESLWKIVQPVAERAGYDVSEAARKAYGSGVP